ncbi:MAG: hypothetical protein WCR72_14650 [Bacteroidota bacterium]
MGMMQLVSGTEKGIEKAHELHAAEANLKNTMQNMGTFSQEFYEATVAGSKKLASGMLFSTAQVVGLQAQLRMVGNISESEMGRMTTASADMATKLGMGLDEAGNMLAKAINNPELMMRLGQRIKIDPAALEHMKALAKGGHEALARLELLTIVEQKVGGAAKAAFDADPLSVYNKKIGGMQVALGEAAIQIQAALAPALILIAEKFKGLAEGISKSIVWMTRHKNIVISTALAIGTLSIAMNWLSIRTQALIYWNSILAVKEGIAAAATWVHYYALVAWEFITGVVTGTISMASIATSVWTGIQWALNAALTANPIGAIVMAIIALITAIAYVVYKTDGWGKQWDSVVNFMKYSFQAFVEAIKLYFNTWIEGFMMGLDFIRIGWYKFKEALHIGDSTENKSEIAKIHADIEARKTALTDGAKKVADLTGKAKDSLKWELSWNNERKVSDLTGGGKDKLGEHKIAPVVAPGSEGKAKKDKPDKLKTTTDGISAGGTRNSNIIINLRSMVENIVFDGNMAEKRSDLENEVTSIMARVLAMAKATA